MINTVWGFPGCPSAGNKQNSDPKGSQSDNPYEVEGPTEFVGGKVEHGPVVKQTDNALERIEKKLDAILELLKPSTIDRA